MEGELKMFYLKDLKQKIEKIDDKVGCPVKGCSERVDIMKRRDQSRLNSYLGTQEDKLKDFEKYLCKTHKIYISPTSIIYKYLRDNLFWYDDSKVLLDKIINVKRWKHQLFYHNSEDALSWNVFRFLERNNMVDDFLQEKLNIPIANSKVIYWSYSQSDKSKLKLLNRARSEFELRPSAGSEPDVIILSNSSLVIMEVKLTNENKNGPGNPNVEEKFVSGGHGWWNKVFRSNFKTVAIKNRKYELMRFWLLGTWMAKQRNIDFHLINLVPSDREKNIEAVFKKNINEKLDGSQRREFLRINWEDIYEYILDSPIQNSDKTKIMNYFENKAIFKNGNVFKTFSI